MKQLLISTVVKNLDIFQKQITYEIFPHIFFIFLRRKWFVKYILYYQKFFSRFCDFGANVSNGPDGGAIVMYRCCNCYNITISHFQDVSLTFQ